MDADGRSRISAEDAAIAVIDEAELPRFIQSRFTIGYWTQPADAAGGHLQSTQRRSTPRSPPDSLSPSTRPKPH